MAAGADDIPQCGLHYLKFAVLEEYPDDTPDFSDVLGSLATRRCRAKACRRDGARMRVPLCAEDVIATGKDEMFDDEGFCVGLCPKHAELVLSRAVEGRACSGSMCSGVASEDSGGASSVSQPQCGRVRVGARLFCETCDIVRRDTGKTPVKPLRAVRGPPTTGSPAALDDEHVSPLTDGSAGGAGVVQTAAGLLGAALGAVTGTGGRNQVMKSSMDDALNDEAVERCAGAGVSPDATTLHDGGVGEPPLHFGQGAADISFNDGAGGEVLGSLMDVLGSVKEQLGRLERRQVASEMAIMDRLTSAPSSVHALGASLDSSQMPHEGGGGAGLVSARKMGADVMEQLRGVAHVDDASSTPTRRLAAVMAAVDSHDATGASAAAAAKASVMRSPEQVQARSRVKGVG